MVDDLFHQPVGERDRGRHEALVCRIQRLSIARVMSAPIIDYRTPRDVGPRIAEHRLDSVRPILLLACEEVRLKGP